MDGTVDFNDILQQATQLSAEIESTSELPRVQRNLRQVLEAGQQLLERTLREGPRVNADTKAAVFLGTKGVDITKLSEKLEPLGMPSDVYETYEPLSELDLDDFLRGERMNAMCAIVSSTTSSILEEIEDSINMRLHEDWQRQKEEITASLSGSFHSLQFEKTMYDHKMDPISPLSQTELTYAHEINQYNAAVTGGSATKPILIERLQLAAKNNPDALVQELWSVVSSLLSALPSDSSENLMQRRTSENFIDLMVSRAKKHLENSFFKRLQNEVWNNLGESNIGGVPSVTKFVKSYISMKNLDKHQGLDIGAGNAGPVWLTTYLLLRCGKTEEAATYMRDEICNTELSRLLEDYEKSGKSKLPYDSESNIRMEYRRNLKNNTRDPFRKAIYCILGGCNVEEDLADVAPRLDDYLWIKLSVTRHNPDQRYVVDCLTYYDLQKQIKDECGESHFDAFKQPFVYAQALLLTGQFEAAIEFMSRIRNMLSHSIHIAVALNESKLLLVSDVRAPMLAPIEGFPGLNRVNFCKMMVSFARSLEGCSAKDALNYLFLLKNIKDEKGHDLFSICVGDMILESRDFEVFGTMNQDGCKTPGLLDQMGIPAQPIIIRCAVESENLGLLEDAALLYDLACDYDQALVTLCRIISQQLTKPPLPDSPRERVQKLAVVYAERFQNHPPKLLKDPSVLNSFFMLVDFFTFFDTVYSKQIDNAIGIIQRLKILPMERSEVEKCVEDFRTFPSAIRDNIPHIVSAAMEVIYLKYQQIKATKKNTFVVADIAKTEMYLQELRTKANAIVTFCGMISYFMTDDVYVKVMQIEVQMN